MEIDEAMHQFEQDKMALLLDYEEDNLHDVHLKPVNRTNRAE